MNSTITNDSLVTSISFKRRPMRKIKPNRIIKLLDSTNRQTVKKAELSNESAKSITDYIKQKIMTLCPPSNDYLEEAEYLIRMRHAGLNEQSVAECISDSINKNSSILQFKEFYKQKLHLFMTKILYK